MLGAAPSVGHMNNAEATSMNINEQIIGTAFVLMAEWIESGAVVREWLDGRDGRRFLTGGGFSQ